MIRDFVCGSGAADADDAERDPPGGGGQDREHPTRVHVRAHATLPALETSVVPMTLDMEHARVVPRLRCCFMSI
jgi:hypothetical protein